MSMSSTLIFHTILAIREYLCSGTGTHTQTLPETKIAANSFRQNAVAEKEKERHKCEKDMPWHGMIHKGRTQGKS